MHQIDWFVLCFYFVGILYVILKVRKVGNIEDFAVASRNVAGPIVFATLAASIVGPGYTIGLGEKGYNLGYIFYFICLMFCVQTIFTAFFIAPKLRKFENAFTIGDIIGIHYGYFAKFLCGIVSFLYCAAIVGVVAKASGDLIHYFTKFDFFWSVIVSTLIVIIYSTHGGIKAVVVTDVLQFIVLVICIPLVLFFAMEDINFNNFQSLYNTNFADFGGGLSSVAIFGLAVSFLLGEALVPPYVSRALMAKSPEDAKKGFLFSGLFMIFWYFIVISIGVCGRFIFADIPPSSTFFEMMSKYTPVGILGLIAASLISVIMSTMDSFLNTGSVVFTFDLMLTRKKDSFKEKALKTTKFVNILTGVLAVTFALSIPNLIDAIVIVFTFWAPSVVLPLMICVLKKKVNPLSGALGIFFGILTTAICEFGFSSPPFGLPSVITGIVGNQIAFWVVELINPDIKSKLLVPIKIN
ncbi:MAG: sodium:solute symporter family protein [Bacteroidota bacterium]